MVRFKCLIEETIKFIVQSREYRLRQLQAPPPTTQEKKRKKIKYVIYLGFLEFKIVNC